MLSMCLLFCFVIFWMLCCVMCEKNKKMLITKKIYACYRSERTSFIGKWYAADVQPGVQVENRFAGMPGVKKKKKKKDIRISKLKIKCQPSERIFE